MMIIKKTNKPNHYPASSKGYDDGDKVDDKHDELDRGRINRDINFHICEGTKRLKKEQHLLGIS